jgi:hypothetical protein
MRWKKMETTNNNYEIIAEKYSRLYDKAFEKGKFSLCQRIAAEFDNKMQKMGMDVLVLYK